MKKVKTRAYIATDGKLKGAIHAESAERAREIAKKYFGSLEGVKIQPFSPHREKIISWTDEASKLIKED